MRHTLLYIGALLLVLCGCKSTKPTNNDVQASIKGPQFQADSAYAFCAAQCQFGPRTMNSTAHDDCAQWIKQKFEQYGCTVEMQQATVNGYDGTPLRATNIIAHAHRNKAAQERDAILVCAHWDSRPWADNDPDSTNWHKPVMAANDGASGVAVMLELARLIQQHDSLGIDVDFVCFDAEDWGIPQWSNAEDNGNTWALGAQHWAAEYAKQTQKTSYRFGILLDMVGGQGAHFYQERLSMQYAQTVVDRVWQAAQTAGYSSLFPTEPGGAITDDHVPVNDIAYIPCIDIIAYYPDCQQSTFGPTWHTVIDDMQHIDRVTLKAVGQTLVQVLYTE